jgi:hypothetical protein
MQPKISYFWWHKAIFGGLWPPKKALVFGDQSQATENSLFPIAVTTATKNKR